jgi:hypothetical protein
VTGGRRAGCASPAGVAVAAAALALLAGGCGGEAGDLMLVQRSGDIPGARLSLRFTEDGRVGCDREALRQLTSPQTITVRDLHRRFAGDERPGPATRHLRLAPGPGAVLRYRVAMKEGDVAFSDTSRGQTPAFFETAKLTRDVARRVCRRPR